MMYSEYIPPSLMSEDEFQANSEKAAERHLAYIEKAAEAAGAWAAVGAGAGAGAEHAPASIAARTMIPDAYRMSLSLCDRVQQSTARFTTTQSAPSEETAASSTDPGVQGSVRLSSESSSRRRPKTSAIPMLRR